MSKLKFSFLVLMLMVSVSASADWAPADVQAALKKMYPTADGVAWSHDESYYVADFLMNGFDTKVWFDGRRKGNATDGLGDNGRSAPCRLTCFWPA